MKKIILSFLLLISMSLYSQIGYHYGGHFVQLEPDTIQRYYVQSCNVDSINRFIQDNPCSDSPWGLVKGFTTSSIKDLKQDYYVSKTYKSKNGGHVFVLPQLLVSLKNGYTISDVTSKYSELLKLEKVQVTKGVYILSCSLKNAEDVWRLNSLIEKMECVKWCEPNMLCEWNTCDYYLPDQYYLQNNVSGQYDINVFPVWQNITCGSNNVTVAILDSGIDTEHEDLNAACVQGYTVGYPQSQGKPININIYNNKGHGTACAGIVGAIENEIGIRGVSSGVKLLPVNIVPYYAGYEEYLGNVVLNEGFASNLEIAAAIEWASARADILSCSWGSGSIEGSNLVSQAFDNARTYGRNGKGCVIVASSGNDYHVIGANVKFPACLNGVIAVGAIDRYGIVQSYSQRDSTLDIVAPSGTGNSDSDIYTTDMMGEYGYNTSSTGNDISNRCYTKRFGGTSAACPQVSAVAALMLSANPYLTEQQIRNTLKNTCKKLPAYSYNTFGWNYETGYGLLDAYAAVDAVQFKIAGTTVPCDQSVYYVENLPDSCTVSWSWESPSTSYIIAGGGTPTLTDYAEILQDTPSPNQCRIDLHGQIIVQNVLVATIIRNGIVIKTLQKTIASGANFSGIYSQNAGLVYGGYIPEAGGSFGNDDEIYLYKGGTITLTSPMFTNATIAHSGTAVDNWIHNGNTISFTFRYYAPHDPIVPQSLPSLINDVVLTITGISTNSCDRFSFRVRGRQPLTNHDPVLQSNEDEKLSITLSGKLCFASVNVDDGWELNIINAATGAMVYESQVEGKCVTLNTTGWQDGIYVAVAKIGKQYYTQKFTVGR